jgi:perosamine synthetase
MFDHSLLTNPYLRVNMVPNIAQSLSLSDVFSSFKHNERAPETFAEEFRKLLGTRYSLATSSGRCALYIILKALGVGKANEVIIPSFACGALADAVLRCGARPVLADVSSETGLMDCGSVQASLTARTRAIVPVHYEGLACDMGELRDLATSNTLFLVEDCAQVLGTKHEGNIVGTIGDVAFFSFGPDKPLTTGHGGMITTSSHEVIAALNDASTEVKQAQRLEGRMALRTLLETAILYRKEVYGFTSFAHVPLIALISHVRGPNQFQSSRISRLAAQVGLLQLKRIRRIIASRIANASILHRELEDSKYVSCPEYDNRTEPVFLRYTVLARKPQQRERLVATLKRNGVDAGPKNWRRPLHELFYYARVCKKYVPLKGTENFASRFINLPCHQLLDAADVSVIAKCLS